MSTAISAPSHHMAFDPQQTTPSTCPRCGSHLLCGASQGQCWCMQRPPLGFDPGYQSCLCSRCLAELAAQADLPAQ